MRIDPRARKIVLFFVTALLALSVTACNLSSSPEEQTELTAAPTNTGVPTRTPSAALTPLPIPTQVVTVPTALVPTAQVFPTFPFLPRPTNTPSVPGSVFILSPISGNVVSGNVQVIGSATHPDFLQYQLEYGPDPNPGNLWFPITGAVQSSVSNGLLGIWNTSIVQDNVYQLRLRVFLRNGTEWGNVAVNNVRVQNQSPTPIPTNTPQTARPIASFNLDRTTGTAPLVVRFTNQSTGQITAYNWSFGDGSTSNQQNPTHTFQSPGTYNVVLTVSGPGGTSNVSRQVNVQSIDPPVAIFTANQFSGPAPLEVKFQSQSTGQITRHDWNFGDGSTSGETDPTHIFQTVGTYNVILTVSGPGGSSSVVRRITVEDALIPPPSASFRPTQTVQGNVPLTVTFENTSSGQVESLEWDFGDGTTTTEPNPTHTYIRSGNYQVTLRVYGPGGQDIATLGVQAVQPPDAPRARLEVEGETTGRAPFTVTFINRSEGQITNYRWDFGDGQQSDSAEQRVTHQFTAPGTYNVRLTVANETGGDTVEQTINVLTPLVEPDALFTASPLSGPAPLSVEFNNQSSGDNLTFQWDFGTGDTSSDPGPLITYEFTQSGTYNVRLTASNADENLSDTHEVTIEVGDEVVVVEPLEVSFIARPDPMTPFGFILEGTATGGSGEYNYSWDFGIEGAAPGSGQTTSVIYSDPGTYTITLTVDDGDNTASVRQQVTPLSASFVATIAPDNPLMVLLNASANGGTGEYTYNWNFGASGLPEGSGQSTSVTYEQAGTYTITLAVRDGVSAPVMVQQSVTVSAPEPEPTATDVPSTPTDVPPPPTDEPPTPTDVPPADTATPLPEPVIGSFDVQRDPNNPNVVGVQAFASGGAGEYSFAWNFGAEGVPDATGPVTQATYPNPGTFTITLVVTDSAGQSTSAQQQVTIDAPTPTPTPMEPVVASFDVQRDPNNPNVVGVQAFASGGAGEYSFTWNFGAEGVPDATGPVTQATYPNPGTFTITLVVTDSAGQSTSAQQQVTIDAPTPTPAPDPLQASFLAIPDPNTPRMYILEATASGGTAPYTFAWNFGAEGVPDATGEVTSVTYPQAGTFTITLAVTDSAGQSTSSQQTVTPVTASFNVSASPDDPQMLFLEATASGGTGNYSYNWNFGLEGVPDGAGQTTSVTYPMAGTFTIRLTVIDGVAAPVRVEQQVTVEPRAEPTPTVPAQVAENLAENEPILPNLNDVDDDIRPVFQASGRPIDSFSVMGDRTIATDRFLEPFGTGNYVIADPSLSYLEDVIANFGSTGSFTRQRYAVDQNLTVRDLLSPSPSGDCNPDESRLRCELRLSQPSIVLLSVGYNDVLQMTDPNAFAADLTQVIREILGQNAVPVLLTLYPPPDPTYQAQIVDINNAIIRVANDEQGQIGREIPLYNQWRALDGLPNSGLQNGEPSVDPQGAGYLSPSVNTGENVRNLETLILLYELWMRFGQ